MRPGYWVRKCSVPSPTPPPHGKRLQLTCIRLVLQSSVLLPHSVSPCPTPLLTKVHSVLSPLCPVCSVLSPPAPPHSTCSCPNLLHPVLCSPAPVCSPSICSIHSVHAPTCIPPPPLPLLFQFSFHWQTPYLPTLTPSLPLSAPLHFSPPPSISACSCSPSKFTSHRPNPDMAHSSSNTHYPSTQLPPLTEV